MASIARDDPSPLPGMHRDHNALPSRTDGQTDTDIVAKREMYTRILHLALKKVSSIRRTSSAASDESEVVELCDRALHHGRSVAQFGADVVVVAGR